MAKKEKKDKKDKKDKKGKEKKSKKSKCVFKMLEQIGCLRKNRAFSPQSY